MVEGKFCFLNHKRTRQPASSPVIPSEAEGSHEIPPLRFAPVGMTERSLGFGRADGAGEADVIFRRQFFRTCLGT